MFSNQRWRRRSTAGRRRCRRASPPTTTARYWIGSTPVAVGRRAPRCARRRPAAARPSGCGRAPTTATGTSDVRQVGQRVVVEQDRPEERDVDEHRARPTVAKASTPSPDVGAPNSDVRPRPRNSTTRPVASWLAPRGEHEEGVHERRAAPPASAPASDADPRVAGLDADGVGGERAARASSPRCRG